MRRVFFAPLGNLLRRQSARFVGARYDLQWAITRTALIQVQPQGKHLLEHLNGRLNMRDPVLNGPCGEASDLDFLLNGDREILMPGNLPIRFRRLVKENAPHDQRVHAEHSLDQGANCRPFRDLSNGRHHFNQVSHRMGGMARSGFKGAINPLDKIVHSRWRQSRRNNGEPLLRKFV